uniref:(northern house mosquito) hypothetical protein n=1 Tax=Culex pipiens TaxID=7175 RepID=A0A8D8HCB0_CULPI
MVIPTQYEKVNSLNLLQLATMDSTVSLVSSFKLTRTNRRSRGSFRVMISMQSSLNPSLLYSNCSDSSRGQLRVKKDIPLNETRGQCVRYSSRSSGRAIVSSDASDMSRQLYRSERSPSMRSKRSTLSLRISRSFST